MSTFLNALHVVLAVLVIGPLVVAPFVARWAIGKRSADGVRFAANLEALFGAGAVLVAVLGVATVLTGDEWDMRTPWVLISSTLFVVALGLIWGYAVPALRRAATLVSAGVVDQFADADAGAEAALTTTASRAGEVSVDTVGAELAGAGEDGQSTEDPVDTGAPEALAGRFVTTADLAAKQRLDSLSARITGAGWLLLVTFVAITVLMTWRPLS